MMKVSITAILISFVILFTLGKSDEARFDIYSSEEYANDEINTVSGQYSQLSNDSLLWGPYRSSLYFGIRPRIPRSLLSGLMWFNVDSYDAIGNLRHVYEQGDNMKKANWVSYDPRTGGRLVVSDQDCHIDVIIDFVKSEDGKSWGTKIKGVPHKGYEKVKTSFVWYSGLEGETERIDDYGNKVSERNGYLNLDNKKNVLGYADNVKLSGISEELGLFELEIGKGPKSNKHPTDVKLLDPELDTSKSHHYSLTVPDDHVWKARDIFMTMLMESVKELTNKYGDIQEFPPEQAFIIRDLQNFEGNLHFVQNVFEGKCEFDVIYTNAVTPEEDKITFDNINTKAKKAIKAFDKKFSQSFDLKAPFNNDKTHEKFAKEMLSGLLGGLSYFYGDHLVDRNTVFDEDSFESYQLQGSFEGPHELFTLVPSRPFFPRGFYWDEGFHLLPLLKFDSDLALEVVQSWFNLIDDDGWIAREQILGPELRSKVPEQFQVQSPEIVNPPTLMLIFSELLESIQNSNTYGDINEPQQVSDYGDGKTFDRKDLGLIIIKNPEVMTDYAKRIYPKLKTHFEWFRRTQQGYIEEFDRGTNKEGYRWRGRTLTHCLASGLDDYPRVIPADIAELNVDLLSWVGVMTKSMKSIARFLNYQSDFEKYQKIENDIVENLDNLHWSDSEKTYCDLSVDDNDENKHTCHKGYISLFPFLTKLTPANDVDKIEQIVDLISDPDELWSDYGIRSLSKSNEFYGTEENYWRSPIWIHMNSLILESLQHYSKTSSPYMSKDLKQKISETYKNLRTNVVNNIIKQWKRTGFVWEQYDDQTGKAKGAKNFLGWTSTVLIIMNMDETI